MTDSEVDLFTLTIGSSLIKQARIDAGSTCMELAWLDIQSEITKFDSKGGKGVITINSISALHSSIQ